MIFKSKLVGKYTRNYMDPVWWFYYICWNFFRSLKLLDRFWQSYFLLIETHRLAGWAVLQPTRRCVVVVWEIFRNFLGWQWQSTNIKRDYPPKFNIAPEKLPKPNGACLPNTIFQGQTVNLWGCNTRLIFRWVKKSVDINVFSGTSFSFMTRQPIESDEFDV